MSKCRDGVDLPAYGPCPSCGATADDQCRGRAYGEMMSRTAALKDARERERGEKLLREQFDRNRDKRLAR